LGSNQEYESVLITEPGKAQKNGNEYIHNTGQGSMENIEGLIFAAVMLVNVEVTKLSL
jgi:hypothetical protein